MMKKAKSKNLSEPEALQSRRQKAKRINDSISHWSFVISHSLQRRAGFTLIELLIVIAVIVVLAGLSAFGFRGTYETSRDAQRRSDISQYQNALEVSANNNFGLYPSRRGSTMASTTLCGDLSITDCSEDPLYAVGTPWYYYRYRTPDGDNDGSNSATSYVLWARLEDTRTCGASTCYLVVCSDGRKEVRTSAPSSGNCPI